MKCHLFFGLAKRFSTVTAHWRWHFVSACTLQNSRFYVICGKAAVSAGELRLLQDPVRLPEPSRFSTGYPAAFIPLQVGKLKR
jgi:hypothetical protein